MEYKSAKKAIEKPLLNRELVKLYLNKASIPDDKTLRAEWEKTRDAALILEGELLRSQNLRARLETISEIYEGWALRTLLDGSQTHFWPVDETSNSRSASYYKRNKNEASYTVRLTDNFRDSLGAFLLGEDFDKDTAIAICKDWAGPGLLPQGVEWGKAMGVISGSLG